MSEELSIALSLLLIGMITVFVVLLLVVITGNLLINFVNRFLPVANQSDNSTQAISNKQIAAITATVNELTGGKGTVQKIEKL